MSQQMAVELGGAGKVKITGDTFASTAESVMDAYMAKQGQLKWREDKLTTTKLRGIYSLIMNVYVQVNSPDDYERHKADIQYLKVRMAYEAGRERAVKEFLDTTNLMRLVDSISNFEQFRLYCRYAEALVAYFKYFGGRDS